MKIDDCNTELLCAVETRCHRLYKTTGIWDEVLQNNVENVSERLLEKK